LYSVLTHNLRYSVHKINNAAAAAAAAADDDDEHVDGMRLRL
jgi:hypothetical protein